MASSTQQVTIRFGRFIAWFLRLLLPLAALYFLGLPLVNWLREGRETPQRKTRPEQLQVVQAQPLTLSNYTIQHTSQGTVRPAAEAELSAEVAGRVVWVSEQFREGKIVAQSAELLRIEQADYQAQVILAQSEVARVQASLEEEQARAERALSEWKRVRGNSTPPPLAIREPQLKQAQAALQAAQASLGQAQRNLERTSIRAPWDGFVRSQAVDVGQFVNRGETLGELFTSSKSEVWLPLSQRQLSLLPRERIGGENPLPVKLISREQGVVLESTGQAMRLSAELDADTRQQFLIVEVQHPDNSPNLRINAFVEAQFEGTTLEDMFVLDPVAVRESLNPEAPLPAGTDPGKVYLIQEDLQDEAQQRLYSRQVAIYWRTPNEVVIAPLKAGSLQAGQLISLTNLQRIPEGQAVRVRQLTQPSESIQTGDSPSP